MEDLHLSRISALVPEFSVTDLPLGRTQDDDDDRYTGNNHQILLDDKSILLSLAAKSVF